MAEKEIWAGCWDLPLPERGFINVLNKTKQKEKEQKRNKLFCSILFGIIAFFHLLNTPNSLFRKH